MANGHGGARPGAGRKKKPLADKILEGNPGKRPVKTVQFEGAGAAAPEPQDFMKSLYIGQLLAPKPDEIFRQTAAWLQTTGCGHLVNPDIINDYAIAKSRWYEVEEFVSRTGFVRKAGAEKVNVSEYIAASEKYFRMADVAWTRIWRIVAENSAQVYNPNQNDEAVLGLLNFNPREA
jgi:hypothetical protein